MTTHPTYYMNMWRHRGSLTASPFEDHDRLGTAYERALSDVKDWLKDPDWTYEFTLVCGQVEASYISLKDEAEQQIAQAKAWADDGYVGWSRYA